MERQDLLHKSAVSSFIQQWGGLGLPQMPLLLIQTWICHRVLLSSNARIQKDLTPQEACKDPTFCSFHDSDGLHLKKSHPYYHQVQIQLFVEIDLYDWCDFCIYTPKGIDVDRISLDIEWCDIRIPELDSYYDVHILPEILSPMYKPSYVL